MGEKFAETGLLTAVSTTFLTPLAIGVTVTTTRLRLYYFYISTGGTPADNSIRWSGQRFTAGASVGSTSVVPQNVDTNGPVSRGVAWEEGTSGTYTAGSEWWEGRLAQRASHAWYSRPQCEIIVPATVSAGMSLRALHASYTGSAECTMHHDE